MKDQINTIRAALAFLDARFGWAPGEAPAIDALRAALTQLEAMVGSQEPVAWQRRMRPTWGNSKAPWGPWEECSEGQAKDYWRTPMLHDWAYEARALYTAAPVAQQYEAGDMASAAAQGFRDGVASVTQQEPVAWAMPKGDGTFIDVITPAEHAREEGSYAVPLFARPVAQQPQADIIKRQANKIAELTADRDGWIEAHARLHREYHDFRKAAPEQAESVPQVIVHPAPVKTVWGSGMACVDIELSRDETATVFFDRSALALAEKRIGFAAAPQQKGGGNEAV